MPSYVCGELTRRYTGSSKQKRLVRRFSTRWDSGVITAALTEATLLAEFGVAYGVAHPEVPNAVTTDVEHDVDEDNPYFWVSTFTYELNRLDRDDQQRDVTDPKNRTPRVSGAWETTRIVVPDEVDGTLIKNSAGDVPDPRFEVDGENMGFHIEADVYPLPAWIFSYRNRRGVINDAPFYVYHEDGTKQQIQTGCAKLTRVRYTTLQRENGYAFFTVSFDLLQQEPPPSDPTQDGWVLDQVDAGMRELVDTDPGAGITLQQRQILDAEGNEITSPVLLDGNGHPLANPNTDTPFIFYRNGYTKKDFTVLPACSAT